MSHKTPQPFVRFAPSPTGYLHLGNTRTALLNWLYAKHSGGRVLLRLDDTDLERSQEHYAVALREDLTWLGLIPDVHAKQSDRLDRYKLAMERLIAMERLYPCYETTDELDFKRKRQMAMGKPPLYDRASLHLTADERAALEAKGTIPHWRFHLNPATVQWHDLIKGTLTFEGTHQSDPILVRADGAPVYTLASVVDDIELGITHILRGEDHVANTAVQIQIIEALTGQPCTLQFAHANLIVDATGQGFSKRLGSLSLRTLRDEGIEPMAINSFLGRLGTSEPIEPFLTLDAIAATFDFSKFSTSTSSKFDLEELHHLNAKLLHMMPYDMVVERLAALNIEGCEDFWLLVRDNLMLFRDVKEWHTICYGDIQPKIEEAAFIKEAHDILTSLPFDDNVCAAWLDALKASTGRRGKNLFMPLRLALTGLDHGPELKGLLMLMGRDRALERLKG